MVLAAAAVLLFSPQAVRAQSPDQAFSRPYVGAGTLVFGRLSEVTRQVDVTVRQAGASTEQQDEQGMLRFGVGVEQRLTGPFRDRGTALPRCGSAAGTTRPAKKCFARSPSF